VEQSRALTDNVLQHPDCPFQQGVGREFAGGAILHFLIGGGVSMDAVLALIRMFVGNIEMTGNKLMAAYEDGEEWSGV